MFDKIYKNLKANGIDVYSIGQEADTTKPHVYIKEYTVGEVTGTQFGNYMVDIFINYPLGKYSKVNEYIDYVTRSMALISDLKRDFSSQPVAIDDGLGVYTTSITYTQKRKVK